MRICNTHKIGFPTLKDIQRRWCGVSLIILVSCFCLNAKAESIRVVVNHAPPYRIIDRTKDEIRFSGFYIDIANEMAKRANLNLTYSETPFKRALAMMESGSADLMLGPNRTPAREKNMLYLDEELPREKKIFYLKPNAQDIEQYEHLQLRSVAVLRGAVYFDRFDIDRAPSKVKIGNYESGLKMVILNRVDTVIIPELLGDYLIGKLGLKLKKASYSHAGRASFFAISRRSPLFEKRKYLNSILREMKKDGTFQALIERRR